MNKKLNMLISVCLMIFSCLIVPIHAEEQQSGIEFSVKARQVENQINKNITYFYLRSEPNEKQQLEVEVTNQSAKTISVQGSVNLALSNDNGYITFDGSVTGREDKSMKYNINDFTSIEKDTLELAPFDTQIFTVDLHYPSEPFEGIMLGGIHFEKIGEESTHQAGIGHTYSYNIGLIIVGDEANELQASKSLELIDITSNVVNGDKVNTLRLRNPEPAILRSLEMHIEIIQKSTLHTMIKTDVDMMEIAPNSWMDYHVNWNKRDVVPGTYIAKITANSLDETWSWEYEFEIAEDTAKEMNEASTNKMTLPRWHQPTLIIMGLATVICVSYIFVRASKQKTKEED